MNNYGLNDNYGIRELSLDSYDASFSGGGGQFSQFNWPVFQLPRMLNNVVGIKVLEVQVPASWYIFNTYNNTFQLLDGTGAATVTIPVGTYTSSQMLTVLGTALTAASVIAGGNHTYAVTYSPTTSKFTITSNQVAGTFSLVFGGLVVGPDGAPRPEGNYDPSVALGMNALQVSTPAPAATLVAPNIALLSGPIYLYLNSEKVGNLVQMYLPEDAENHGAEGPQLASIPVNVSPEGIINWSDPDPQKFFAVPDLPNISQIDFYFTLGNWNWAWPSGVVPLDFNGLSFHIKFVILYEKADRINQNVAAVTGGVQATVKPKGAKRQRR